MWKKMLRKRQSLNYRKKFKCPICDEFSICIIHDKACECKNGCDTSHLNVEDIMNGDDYCCYYTASEIEENFWSCDEECNKILKEITKDNTLDLFTDAEKKTIESFFKRTADVDERLDDIMANYLNINNLKDVQTINPFGYLINLIEDAHLFINLCCKDVILFNYGVEFASKHFYSGRFFYNNAVEHLFQANERVIVILGIINGYKSESNVEEFVKKHPNYKKYKYNEIFERLKGNTLYGELKNIRESNDHKLSYISKVISDDIKEHGYDNAKFWNRDGNDVDKDIYLPIIKNIIFCLNEFYNLLDKIIKQVSEDVDVHQLQCHPMIEKFMKIDDKITFKTYQHQDIERLDKYNKDLFAKLQNYNDGLVKDIFFRMDEVVHCIRDICNIANNSFYEHWNYMGAMQLNCLIDEQYLLYSALMRVYSCYDKLACYIANNNTQYKDIKYFKDFKKKTESNGIMNKVKNILCSEDQNYKLLSELRNDIYHNIRVGCLYGNDGLNFYNLVLFKAVFENTVTLYEFINFLDPKTKIKIGRNDICTCGSGKKYKKCCAN